MGSSCIIPSQNYISNRIKEGKVKLRDLRFLKVLKKNKISTVWLVESKKQKTFYALKAVDKTQSAKLNCINLSINQQQVLMKLSSTYIANCLSTFQDSKNLYFILEYMPYGNLRDYLTYHKKMTEIEARFLVICILNGLDYLNLNQIIHLDIKPQNIVIDSGAYFRLCDFNLSKTNKNKKIKLTSPGTFGYQAPQIINKSNNIFRSCDYYSLGVVLFECITGQSPRNFQVTQKNVRNYFKSNQNISDQCVQFICGLICSKVQNRLGHKTIYEIWQHPWLALQIYEKKQYQQKTLCSPLSKQYQQFFQKKKITNSNRNTDDSLLNSSNQSQDKTIRNLKLNSIRFQKKFQKFKYMDKKIVS